MGKRALREGISDSLRQHDVSGKPRQTRTSRAYQRYFEDYVETNMVMPNGKIQIQRMYVGDYYCQNIPLWQRLLIRIVYLLLFSVSAVLYYSNGMQSIYCNQIWYVTLCQFATMACIIWSIVGLAEYLFSMGKLTIGEYKSVIKKLHKAPYFATATMWLTMAASALCLIVAPEAGMDDWPVFLSKYLAAGVLMLAIPTIDKRIAYEITASEGKQTRSEQEDEDE